MQRNMDLIREMLIAVADHDRGYAPRPLEIEPYSAEEIGYHAYLMIDAGLAEGADTTTRGSDSPEAQIINLTSAGHEFLESAREPTRWEQAKEVIQKAGGASIQVWTSVLTDIVKSNLGL